MTLLKKVFFSLALLGLINSKVSALTVILVNNSSSPVEYGIFTYIASGGGVYEQTEGTVFTNYTFTVSDSLFPNVPCGVGIRSPGGIVESEWSGDQTFTPGGDPTMVFYYGGSGPCETNLTFAVCNNDIVPHNYGISCNGVVTAATQLAAGACGTLTCTATCDEAPNCFVVEEGSDGNDHPVANPQPPTGSAPSPGQTSDFSGSGGAGTYPTGTSTFSAGYTNNVTTPSPVTFNPTNFGSSNILFSAAAGTNPAIADEQSADALYDALTKAAIQAHQDALSLSNALANIKTGGVTNNFYSTNVFNDTNIVDAINQFHQDDTSYLAMLTDTNFPDATNDTLSNLTYSVSTSDTNSGAATTAAMTALGSPLTTLFTGSSNAVGSYLGQTIPAGSIPDFSISIPLAGVSLDLNPVTQFPWFFQFCYLATTWLVLVSFSAGIIKTIYDILHDYASAQTGHVPNMGGGGGGSGGTPLTPI
jgi:hypothetical protein